MSTAKVSGALDDPIVVASIPPSAMKSMLGRVEQSLPVRTDLQMEILRRFRDAGIKIPFPVHDARSPGPPAAPPAPAARAPHP
jgi:small-conductance mechanosensitive channel